MEKQPLLKELINSITQNRSQEVKGLLEAGADPNGVEDSHGITPLHFAAIFNSPESAKLLITAGANPNAEDLEGQTALEVARELKHALIVDLLIWLAPR